MREHVTVAKGLFASHERLPPCRMGAILTRGDRNEVTYRSSEHAVGRRKSCGGIRGVPICQNRSLEIVNVELAAVAGVSCDHALDGLDTDFSTAVCMGERNGRPAMSDPPGFQEGLGLTCGKLWTAVASEFVSNAEGGEGSSEARYEAFAPSAGLFDDGPVGVAIHDNEIRLTHVCEVICTHLLERVLGWVYIFWGCIWL